MSSRLTRVIKTTAAFSPVLAAAAGAASPAGAAVTVHVPAGEAATPVFPQLTATQTLHEEAVSVQPGQMTYTVRAGDTLSKIAKRVLGHEKYWPEVWKANEHKIGNPNVITAGEKLVIPGGAPKVSAKVTLQAYEAIPKPKPVVHHTAVLDASTVASDSAEGSAGGSAASPASSVSTVVNPSLYGGFQACVIRAESGGNADVWNASGHWGLYQFSYSTWVGHGGAGADFGRASVAEQTRVFWNTVAADGTSDWAPYDGC